MAGAAKDIAHLWENELTMIGIVEFARQMGVCPNTVRNWIADGRLVQGVHYFRAGRVIRFPWSLGSVERLMHDLSPPPPPPRPRLKSRRTNRGRIRFKC